MKCVGNADVVQTAENRYSEMRLFEDGPLPSIT